jgi:hypothetical protein
MGVAVCVLGPARSGTSLTTRALNLMGVHLGSEDGFAVPSAQANPTGFWERPWISDLNNRLLRSQGGSLADPPELRPGWEAGDDLDGLRTEARAMLEKTFGGHELWGWKDPRACFTLPFWELLIPEMRYVVCVRNPLDVAASVESWAGVRQGSTLPLWRDYMASAIVNTTGRQRIFVAYEDFLGNPRTTAERLARFAACGAPSEETMRHVEEFVDGDLRHHTASAQALLDEGSTPADVTCLYLLVRRLCKWASNEAPGGATDWSSLADAFAQQLLLRRAR